MVECHDRMPTAGVGPAPTPWTWITAIDLAPVHMLEAGGLTTASAVTLTLHSENLGPA